MENNSQPPLPAAPAPEVLLPASEPPKTKQPSSNLEVVPVAFMTATTDRSAAQPQCGTALGSVPLRSVQQHPQPLPLKVLALGVVRPTKPMSKRRPAPPPPKVPVYRPPPPPRPYPPSSSAAGNALQPVPSFCVLNMQADPPSPDQVTMAEEGSDSEGGGGNGDDVQMLDLNFPPVSNNEEN